MDQISGTTPTDAPIEGQQQQQAAGAGVAGERSEIGEPGFGTRGRARRRARFLRRARELAYRDLGGLVFNLHRFGQRNDALVIAKLTTLGQIDAELRTLEAALRERQPVTVLREAGITACARCAAIHSSEDHFCPNCGLPIDRRVDLPAGFQSAGAPAPALAAAPPAAVPASPQPAAASPQPAAASPQPAAAAVPAAPSQGATSPASAPGASPASAPATSPASVPGASPAPSSPPSPGASPSSPGASPSSPAAPRSPAPPSTRAAPAAPRPEQTAPGSGGEEEPTEIVRPPAAGP